MKATPVTPAAGQRGMTALHYAAYSNDPDSVRVQLQRGVAIDVRDESGWATEHQGVTVLMRACGRNNEAILAALIQVGAKPAGPMESNTGRLSQGVRIRRMRCPAQIGTA